MHKIAKAAKAGNLEELKSFLEEDPPALDRTYHTPWALTDVNLLQLASYFNQVEIVKFLVEKGMDINKKGGIHDRTALHYAASHDAYQVVQLLLDLDADASLTDKEGRAPYRVCKNKGTSDVLLKAYNECLREKESGVQIIKKPARKAQENTTAAGAWKPGVTEEEIIFQRDMPELSLRLMETFNFAADIRILVAQNLETGDVSQPETKLFSEIPKMVEQARAERAKLRGPKLVRG